MIPGCNGTGFKTSYVDGHPFYNTDLPCPRCSDCQPEKGGEGDWPPMLYVVVDPPLGIPPRYVGLPKNTWLDTYEVRRYVPAQPSPPEVSEEKMDV